MHKPLTQVPDVQSLVDVQVGAQSLGSADAEGDTIKHTNTQSAGTLGRWDVGTLGHIPPSVVWVR